jgi:hypothetical protein
MQRQKPLPHHHTPIPIVAIGRHRPLRQPYQTEYTVDIVTGGTSQNKKGTIKLLR